MASFTRPLCLLVATLALTPLPCLLAQSKAGPRSETALDRYVAQPDAVFSYEKVSSIPGSNHTVHVLQVTSQKFLTTAEVDQPIWKHWITVIQPNQVRHQTALLFIGGGSRRDNAPTGADGGLIQMALASQSIVAELKGVPNQPLSFDGESEKRSEDSLIAYTWNKFMTTGDSRWPARLPMTKSAVRAMDAITGYLASPAGGGLTVKDFVIAGGSKRGWTTWTTAAVDKRVKAIVPLVIDMLNMEPSFQHHYQAYGFYAPAVGDYESQGVMNWAGSKEYKALLKIEEPYEYRDRFTMPKLIMNATGDQFFLPDSWQFYFNDLPDPKYLRYVPNADHSLNKSDARESLLAFHMAQIQGTQMPNYRWKKDGNDRLEVWSEKVAPVEVKLWKAHNPEKRDFRLETLGAVWSSTPVKESSPGKYEVQLDRPQKGWTASLVELTYRLPGIAVPLKLTTGVYVTPDRLPSAPFVPKPQRGTLAP